VRKIELDAKDKIYYDAKDFQNLLANHGEKMEIPIHTLQGILSQAHWYGDTFWSTSAGKARIPLASMMRK
jgi:putative transposase